MDSGKKGVIELSQLRLMVPDETLVSLPAQAVHCILSGISPVTDIWHEGM